MSDEVKARYEAAMESIVPSGCYDMATCNMALVKSALADIPRLMEENERLKSDYEAIKQATDNAYIESDGDAALEHINAHRWERERAANTIDSLRAQLAEKEKEIDEQAAEIESVWEALGMSDYEGEDSLAHHVDWQKRRIESLTSRLAEKDKEMQATFDFCIPETFGEFVGLYGFEPPCESHEYDNRTWAENAAWLVSELGRALNSFADTQTTAVEMAWLIFEEETAPDGNSNGWRFLNKLYARPPAVGNAITFLLKRGLIEKHPEREWYRRLENQRDGNEDSAL